MTLPRALRLAPARLVLSAFLALGTPSAQAQVGGSSPVRQATILPGWVEADGTRMAALALEMAPGWHTYWRIPGEAGIVPQFDWSRSQNLAEVAPVWPRPAVFDTNGMASFGYEDQLILPLRITPEQPGRPVALMGRLAIGVCNETCVPVDLEVQGVLRGEGDRDARITEALATRVRPAREAGLAGTTCRLEPAPRGAELELRARLPVQGGDERIVVELPGTGYWVSDARTRREGGELVARARIRAPRGTAVMLDRQALAFTVLSDRGMISARGCTGAP